MGGISKERKISLLTGKACVKSIKKNHKVYVIDPQINFIDKLRKIKPDIVFNALHGKYGEDGFVQSILEQEKIKYTHSGVLPSSIAIDKELSKLIFIEKKILTPKYIIYSNDEKFSIIEKINNSKIKFPVVIKPINEGSSLGVFICTKKNIIKKKKYLKNYNKILVEEYIPGREIQVGIMGKKALGAIELKPKRKFYDYYAKYSNKAKTKHIMPAPLEKKKYNEVLNIAKKVHKIIGCKGITRSDFRYYKGKFYLLEINTQPGMTKFSLIPEMAAFQGLEFDKIIKWIIDDASILR